MNILCLNDFSCHSRCSLGIAMPVLTRYGYNVTTLPTGLFSTHTGIENYVMQNLNQFIYKTLEHFDKLGLQFDAVYSGFLLDCQQLDIMKQTIERYSNAQIIIDPVMGDNGTFYKAHDHNFMKQFRSLLKYADILTPNATEAQQLCGFEYKKPPYTLQDIQKFVSKLKELGTKTIILKSVDIGDGKIGVAIKEKNNDSIQYICTKKIDGEYNGCGDLFASILIGEIIAGKHILDASQKACELVKQAIQYTTPQECAYGIAFEKILDKCKA